MFENVQKNTSEGATAPQNLPIEDILATTEPPRVTPSPSMAKPPLSKPTDVGVPSVAASKAPPSIPQVKPSFGKRKIVVTILVLLIGAGVVVVGILAFNLFKTKTEPPEAKTPSKETQKTRVPETRGEVLKEVPLPAPETEFEQERPPSVLDTDQDGLTDEEELKIGTNPREPDTDLDALFDREEVKVYKTNPVLRDTDADGYDDGHEVKNGFNPNGPGKLLEIPKTEATP